MGMGGMGMVRKLCKKLCICTGSTGTGSHGISLQKLQKHVSTVHGGAAGVLFRNVIPYMGRYEIIFIRSCVFALVRFPDPHYVVSRRIRLDQTKPDCNKAGKDDFLSHS